MISQPTSSKLNKNLCKNLCSNLCKNLCKNLYSNLCNNLCNNLDLWIVSLISSNSYLFLYKHLTSFRRFSVEGNFKTPVVFKVVTEVATSVT